MIVFYIFSYKFHDANGVSYTFKLALTSRFPITVANQMILD